MLLYLNLRPETIGAKIDGPGHLYSNKTGGGCLVYVGKEGAGLERALPSKFIPRPQ